MNPYEAGLGRNITMAVLTNDEFWAKPTIDGESKPRHVRPSGRHVDSVGTDTRDAQHVEVVARIVCVGAAGGLVVMVGGVVFNAAAFVSAGLWVVLGAGTFAAVLLWFERVLKERAQIQQEALDGTASGSRNEDQATDALEDTQVLAHPVLAGSVLDSGLSAEGLAGLHGAPSRDGDHDGGRRGVVRVPAESQAPRVLVRVQRARDRFSVVRYQVGGPASTAFRGTGATSVDVLSRRRLRGMRKVR